MLRAGLLVLVTSSLLVACACRGRSTGGGTGSATPSGASCDDARAHAEVLYRAEAAKLAADAAARDELVADNIAMVVADCRADPGRVAGCATAATSVAQLENQCLIPLDDDGTEGQRFVAR